MINIILHRKTCYIFHTMYGDMRINNAHLARWPHCCATSRHLKIKNLIIFKLLDKTPQKIIINKKIQKLFKFCIFVVLLVVYKNFSIFTVLSSRKKHIVLFFKLCTLNILKKFCIIKFITSVDPRKNRFFWNYYLIIIFFYYI